MEPQNLLLDLIHFTPIPVSLSHILRRFFQIRRRLFPEFAILVAGGIFTSNVTNQAATPSPGMPVMFPKDTN